MEHGADCDICPIWEDHQGTDWPLCQMSDKHLHNALRYARRTLNDAWRYQPCGDVATLYHDQFLSQGEGLIEDLEIEVARREQK